MISTLDANEVPGCLLNYLTERENTHGFVFPPYMGVYS